MSKYYKVEDVINKYAEMIASDSYWEYGVGNGEVDEDCIDIAKIYFADLPTIEVSEDCISREYILGEAFASDEYNRETKSFDLPVVSVRDIEDAPSVVVRNNRTTTEQSSMVGEWLLDGRCSECLASPLTTHKNYCPNCGAKMKG